MKDTKEKILVEALELFSKNGYEAVSTGDIASRLNITKPALYKHYKNKMDILDTIIKRIECDQIKNLESFSLPIESINVAPEKYKNVSLLSIGEYSKRQFDYWTSKDTSSYRRLLTLEQHRNPNINRLFHSLLDIGPINYLTDLFVGMYNIERSRAYIDALTFYSPIFTYYSMYDGSEDSSLIRSLAYKHIYESVKGIYEKYS